jgi:hypothetical protein
LTSGNDDEWIKLGTRNLSQATDNELIKWLIAHAVQLHFGKKFWPGERGGLWVGEVIHNATTPGQPIQAKVAFIKPNAYTVNVNASTGDLNVHTTVHDTFPNAKTLSNIIPASKPQKPQAPSRGPTAPKRLAENQSRSQSIQREQGLLSQGLVTSPALLELTMTSLRYLQPSLLS